MYCPFVKGECEKECMFHNQKIDCEIKFATDVITYKERMRMHLREDTIRWERKRKWWQVFNFSLIKFQRRINKRVVV
jgi:hypothetical protein